MTEEKPKFTHLESELNKIKESTLEMMHVVRTQLHKGKEALLTSNKELALDVMHNEKRVNGYETLIDSACENVIACFSPVAVDLRFVLAVLKINYHLERIGDNANGISRNVFSLQINWDKELLRELEIFQAFQIIDEMLLLVIDSMQNEDATTAHQVFEKDKVLDTITKNSHMILAKYLTDHHNNVEEDLHLLLIQRKLERIGDLVKNIAEEMIFFIEAKVLKHIKDRNSN